MGLAATSDGASRTFIKICGVTNREDAHVAIECGADALGFIAVQESPRFITAMAFHRIQEIVPSHIPLVIVVKRAGDAAKYGGDIVQYYDPASIDAASPDASKLLRVVKVRDTDDLESFPDDLDYVDALLLDALHATVLGGSGTRFDWDLVKDLRSKSKKPFILAGGLTPANVEQALESVKPYGVDVSSGVEDKVPGAKDHKLIAEFITNVRKWDAANQDHPRNDVPALFDVLTKRQA